MANASCDAALATPPGWNPEAATCTPRRFGVARPVIGDRGAVRSARLQVCSILCGNWITCDSPPSQLFPRTLQMLGSLGSLGTGTVFQVPVVELYQRFDSHAALANPAPTVPGAAEDSSLKMVSYRM